jgi:hypothetical protein
MPKMTAATIEAADIMAIMAGPISNTTSVNTRRKAITGIPGKITAANTTQKNMPVPKNTAHRSV